MGRRSIFLILSLCSSPDNKTPPLLGEVRLSSGTISHLARGRDLRIAFLAFCLRKQFFIYFSYSTPPPTKQKKRKVSRSRWLIKELIALETLLSSSGHLQKVEQSSGSLTAHIIREGEKRQQKNINRGPGSGKSICFRRESGKLTTIYVAKWCGDT